MGKLRLKIVSKGKLSLKIITKRKLRLKIASDICQHRHIFPIKNQLVKILFFQKKILSKKILNNFLFFLPRGN